MQLIFNFSFQTEIANCPLKNGNVSSRDDQVVRATISKGVDEVPGSWV